MDQPLLAPCTQHPARGGHLFSPALPHSPPTQGASLPSHKQGRRSPAPWVPTVPVLFPPCTWHKHNRCIGVGDLITLDLLCDLGRLT